MRCAPTCTVASDSHTSSSGSSLTPPQLTPRNPLAGRGNKLRVRWGLGQLDSDRVVPVLSLEVLLGLRASGAVVRVHTRECTVNDRKRYEQKITSFGTLDRQCLRWHPIASVIDRSRTPPTTTGLPPSRRCFAPQAAAWLTASASRLAPKAPARSGCTRRARR